MGAAARPLNPEVQDAFVPMNDDGAELDWVGRRGKVQASVGVALKWPIETKARFELFDAWHAVAMQLVERAPGRRFRLMAVARQVLRWDSGQILSTNAELADRAGCCTEKTISRDVGFYQTLGIFKLAFGWRKVRGKHVRTRSIRLALPHTPNADITLPESTFDMDICGPDQWGLEGRFDMDTRGPGTMDTRGPGTMDTRGPITLGKNEGGRDDAA